MQEVGDDAGGALGDQVAGAVLVVDFQVGPAWSGEFDRQGRRLLCCNPRSLLVTDGVLDDAPVIG